MNFFNQNQFHFPCCRHERRQHREVHNHEFQGSVRIVTENEELNNFFFAGVSGPTIHHMNSHFHVVVANTDS